MDDAGGWVERVRYDPWGGRVIQQPDSSPPQVSEIRREGADLLLVMSEPVQPALQMVAGSMGLYDELQHAQGQGLGNVVEIEDGQGTTYQPLVAHEDVAGFPEGTVFRLTGVSFSAGDYTLRIAADTLIDDWSNPIAAVSETFTYDPAVEVQKATGHPIGSTVGHDVPQSLVGNEVGFQAHLHDPEAGLILMRARAFDPTTGQFLQPDPEGHADSVNQYAGMAWDAVNLRDPTGRAVPLVAIGGACLGGAAFGAVRSVAQWIDGNLEDGWQVAKNISGGCVFAGAAVATLGTGGAAVLGVGLGSYSATSEAMQGNHATALVDAAGAGLAAKFGTRTSRPFRPGVEVMEPVAPKQLNAPKPTIIEMAEVSPGRWAAKPDALVHGTRVRVPFRTSRYTPQERGMIDAAMADTNAGIAAGRETSQTGAAVNYSSYASKRFIRDRLFPERRVRDCTVADASKELNRSVQVDERVPRFLGGRQIDSNQRFLDQRINSILGSAESRAVRRQCLPEGTPVLGLDPEWKP